VLPGTPPQVQELSRKNNVLLELLGEKEEEVESLSADLRESKQAYRAQLEELVAQVAAAAAAGGGAHVQ
jgi:predicted ArsR family transcriptional regulator